MSGNLQNLLKYRYQKKEGPKVTPVSTSSQYDRASTSSVVTPTKKAAADSTMPDTPESISSNDSPSVSPVFPGKKPTLTMAKPSSKRGAIVIQSSDSDMDSPVKSNSNSPWLKKQTVKAEENNKPKATVTAKVGLATVTMSSQSDLDEREFNMNIRSLSSMFPAAATHRLESVLRNCRGDLDAAIDVMMGQNLPEAYGSVKRKRVRLLSSSDSETVPTPVKKSRPLDYSDSQSSLSQPFEVTNNKQKEMEENVAFLKGAFPDIPPEILMKTLKESDMDYDKALAQLSTYKPPPPPPSIDKTKNVGSIKAFQAAREQARGSAALVISDSDVEEDNIRDRSYRGKRKKNKKGRRGDDDDDNDIIDIESEDSSQEEDTSLDQQILTFFNDATPEELLCMKGCSKKKADYLISLRTFQSWEDLVAKFEHSDVALPFTLITECKDVIRMRKTVRHLMERCERISGDLESIIANNINKVNVDDLDSDVRHITQQPQLINNELKLMPYQMVGLNWLSLMHRKDLDGILGDEMGLGKTIQTISFLAHLLEIGEKGPHAIVVPSSTIDNWLRELKVWCPTLKVLLYYGSQEERRELRTQITDNSVGQFHLLITTYNIAAGSNEDRALFKKLKFYYAIFDEGHMLKNMGSMRYQSLMRIRARRRLLLTGTPLQNNLIELMSLLNFVMPHMFAGETDGLKRIFTAISNRTKDEGRGAYEKEVIVQAKRILRPFFLRRLKSQVLSQLPRKTDYIEKVPMCFEQQDLYDELKSTFSQRIHDISVSKKKNKDDSLSGANMLMQMRKAANHHLLHRRIYDDTRLRQMAKLMLKEPTHCQADPQLIFEDMQVMSDFELHRLCQQYNSLTEFQLDDEQLVESGKFRYLAELLDNIKAQGGRVLLFSQFTMMLDIMEVFMEHQEYNYIRLDGSTAVAERQGLIDLFNSDTSIFVFLLSTKAGGLGINLTAANYVILHDIDFNPYNDKQAEDRCHRLGQKKDVVIYKLISKNTIEEAMLRCGQAKLSLEADVTGQGRGEEMNPNDVASLLKEALLDRDDDDV